jgi:hypothetical protein
MSIMRVDLTRKQRQSAASDIQETADEEDKCLGVFWKLFGWTSSSDTTSKTRPDQPDVQIMANDGWGDLTPAMNQYHLQAAETPKVLVIMEIQSSQHVRALVKYDKSGWTETCGSKKVEWTITMPQVFTSQGIRSLPNGPKLLSDMEEKTSLRQKFPI